MANSRKRTIQELDSLENANQLILNTSIHGAVTSISTVKSGKYSDFLKLSFQMAVRGCV